MTPLSGPPAEDYRQVNRANWDERAPAHAASPDYAFDRFRTDPSFLSNVVQFDLPRLGDVAGLDGVHLQCQLGTDTLSLARPGGRLFLRDGHPMSWAVDDTRTDGLLTLEYPYFERAEPLICDEPGTYVATDATLTHTRTYLWGHGLAETVAALLGHGLTLTGLVEHETVPWQQFPGRMERTELDEWRLVDRPWRLPLTYTLQARKE